MSLQGLRPDPCARFNCAWVRLRIIGHCPDTRTSPAQSCKLINKMITRLQSDSSQNFSNGHHGTLLLIGLMNDTATKSIPKDECVRNLAIEDMDPLIARIPIMPFHSELNGNQLPGSKSAIGYTGHQIPSTAGPYHACRHVCEIIAGEEPARASVSESLGHITPRQAEKRGVLRYNTSGCLVSIMAYSHLGGEWQRFWSGCSSSAS
jgi:hypothetical protein